MAIFTPGGLVGQISGRVAGTIFSHNRGGPYCRNGTIPTTSQSTYAVAAKGTLQAASMAWQGLTPNERAGWTAYARQTPVTNRLGNATTLSGHQMYVSNYCRMDRAGNTPLSVPPVSEAPAALATIALTLDIGAGAFQIAFTATPLGADERLWMKAAVVQSPGVSYVKNLMKLVSVTAAAQASPYDFQADLEARFGELQVGHVVVVQAHVFDGVTGLLSSSRVATGAITTT